jgi:hypothetical protein
MTSISSQKPFLRLVEGGKEAPAEWAWFCGHCAAPGPHDHPPIPAARVCRECGLGLLLEAPGDAVPDARDAFLVVDDRLLVQAVSREAEIVLGLNEETSVNHPVAEILESADAEAEGTTQLASAIAMAMSGSEEPVNAYVRPWNTYGVRMRARIAPCGPPRAALLVLETRQPRLRSVGPAPGPEFPRPAS